MNKRLATLLPFILYFHVALSQCSYEVTHLSGTALINCVSTTVTSLGLVDTNSTYCNSTSPYLIGWNSNTGNGQGSYTFNFFPSVSALTLNFSGISNTPPNSEEIHLTVNGTHYPIPTQGSSNNCDPMAVLTSAGDIAGCPGCTVSGWNGTTINGPISSLTVTDVIISGLPNGTIFSLLICEGVSINTINLGNDTTLCEGETVLLDASRYNSTYLWQDNSTNATFNVTEPGTYSVNVYDSMGCSATDQIIVDFAPPVFLGQDVEGCLGELILDAGALGAFLWSTFETTQTIIPQISGSYSVLFTDTNNCTSSDTINVIIHPQPIVYLGPDTLVCEGDPLFLNAGNQGANYLWSTFAATQTILTIVSGSYSVTVTDSNHCSNYDTINVTFNPLPIINTSSDQTITRGDSIAITTITNGDNYSWVPEEGLSCTECVDPIASPNETTSYVVTVTDSNGCRNQDTLNILVVDPECEIFLPTAFSPNADGYNDILYVRGHCILTLYFVIFDRLGEKIFEGNNPTDGWDGTYKNMILSPGVYVYRYEATLQNGKKVVKKGNVSLIR